MQNNCLDNKPIPCKTYLAILFFIIWLVVVADVTCDLIGKLSGAYSHTNKQLITLKQHLLELTWCLNLHLELLLISESLQRSYDWRNKSIPSWSWCLLCPKKVKINKQTKPRTNLATEPVSSISAALSRLVSVPHQEGQFGGRAWACFPNSGWKSGLLSQLPFGFKQILNKARSQIKAC